MLSEVEASPFNALSVIPVTADVPSAVTEYQGLRPEIINTFIRGL